MTEDRNFYLFRGPKSPKNWASDVHILHTSKSTCNEHAKQYWCKNSENVLRKWPKTRMSTYFGAQNDSRLKIQTSFIP